jgi:hypothetical protein
MMDWREREARNEAQFRDQNEWIEATHESFGSHDRSWGRNPTFAS